MPEFQLILTADYEVFGNGSGCVNKCVVAPSEDIMSICEKHNTRVTFFVDVCELWAFEEVEEKGLFTDNYRPATAIKSQLKDALKRGHDVQLHFHPQWLEYEFIGNQEWELKMDWWSLPSLPYGSKDDPASILGLFTKGKSYLNSLLKPIDSTYQCIAFRAGAWCIQPEENILKAMREVGLKYETTVAPGMVFDDGLTKYNFNAAPANLSRWLIENSVSSNQANGAITEVPIFTSKIPVGARVKNMIDSILNRNIQRPEGCSGIVASSKRTSFLSKVGQQLSTEYQMLDFCGKTYSNMRSVVESGLSKQYISNEKETIPMVAIGHPKNFGNKLELEKFLLWISSEKFVSLESLDKISFWRN